VKEAIMEMQGTKQVVIGYRVKDGEGIFRFIWRRDLESAKPVHAPENFDPVAFGRQLALEDKQKIKEEIARWRGVRQHVEDGSLSQREQLALAKLVEYWLGELMEQAGGESL
jgi:hypothetical protein